uniref:Uncharacterized protein n=1 Tax=Oryzias latipes TaxID=8090 RepID=A0A3P9IR28_ORYLA
MQESPVGLDLSQTGILILENLKNKRSILKTAKLPPSNITKEEMAAINNLKNNREITILPADKGRTTVIMDTEQYEKQMDEMLQDRNTYEVLKRDPTEAKKRKLKTILKQLQEEKKIDKQTYNHLIPTANIIPRIYGTPKIHKPGAPLRPIIDSMGSVTYNLSKFIADILKPLPSSTIVKMQNSWQKNSKTQRRNIHFT